MHRIGRRGSNTCSPITATAIYFFANNGQSFTSNFSLQKLRVGVNYHFGDAPAKVAAPAVPDPDNVNFHGQTTFSWQEYPTLRSLYEGANSLLGGGEGQGWQDGVTGFDRATFAPTGVVTAAYSWSLGLGGSGGILPSEAASEDDANRDRLSPRRSPGLFIVTEAGG